MTQLEDVALAQDTAVPAITVKRRVKRIAVAIAGSLVVGIGIVMMLYPGPGLLVVFAGLGLLSTEFAWAKRALVYVKGLYVAWKDWMSRQTFALKALVWIATAVVTMTTIWLFNGFGIMSHLVGVHWSWLESPLPFL